MNVISWTDVLARYDELGKLPNVGSSTVQNLILNLAEAEIHSRLSGAYSVPFSSNNMTAHDLMIDMVYVQSTRTRQPEKADAVAKAISAKIDALLAGKAGMTTTTGTLATELIGDMVWSNTAEYDPTFGVSDIAYAAISSTQLYDEAAARGEML